jgi:hypothetical protein
MKKLLRPPAFRERYERLIADLPQSGQAAQVAEARLVTLPANVPPWTDTGVAVRAGDAITLLAEGRVVWADEPEMWAGPRFHLWGRVDGGTIFNGTRDTSTTVADRDGSLELAVYHGEWATQDGRLATPLEMYETLRGGLDVLVIRWSGDAASGLRALQQLAPDDPLLDAEIARLEHPVSPPRGWRHLWFLGANEIFAEVDGPDGRVLSCRVDADVGILQKPVALALAPDATLSWSWKIDRLPAIEAEDTFFTHDYLSIAVEFENGRDLTYTWSAALPAGHAYACPLPTWSARETHLVIRSGAEGLGSWIDESRNVREDYARTIGAPPSRIVAVWLIAVSLFRRGLGLAEYRDISLSAAGETIRVF